MFTFRFHTLLVPFLRVSSLSSLVLSLLTLLHAHITVVLILFLSPSSSPSQDLFPSRLLSLPLILYLCSSIFPLVFIFLPLSLLLFAVCSFPSHFPALPRVEPLRLALPKLSRSRFKIIQLAPDHHPPPSSSCSRQRCRCLSRHPQGRSSSLVPRWVSAAPVTFR